MNKFMDCAVSEAFSGMRKRDGGPFGAVIVKNNKVIAKSHNMVLRSKDPTMHAEVSAIRLASRKLGTYNLNGCSLYTTCEPCPMCLGAILWSRIKKVYFGCTQSDARNIGFDDKLFYSAFSKRKTKLVSLTQIERKLCLEPFAEWQKLKNKTKY